jgi:hypothetical protein
VRCIFLNRNKTRFCFILPVCGSNTIEIFVGGIMFFGNLLRRVNNSASYLLKWISVLSRVSGVCGPKIVKIIWTNTTVWTRLIKINQFGNIFVCLMHFSELKKSEKRPETRNL